MHETALRSILSGAFNESFEQGFPPIVTPRNGSIPAFRMVYLPSGTFIMGDDSQYPAEKPAHKVELSSFYMGEFQVSQELYQAVTRDNPSSFKNNKKPVEQVTWYNAANFCNQLSIILGLQEVYKIKNDEKCNWNKAAAGFRLPTEAEWEYAARGGVSISSDTAGDTDDMTVGLRFRSGPDAGVERSRNTDFIYSGSNNLNSLGWYSDNSYSSTKKNGLKFPNSAGFYDMSGNLWEWCWDCYEGSYYQKCKNERIIKNPDGQQSGNSNVLRGGAWNSRAGYCRSTNRGNNNPRNGWNDRGIRFVLGL
jgi:formylglycine-generating enzyme required for sulfatase activity